MCYGCLTTQQYFSLIVRSEIHLLPKVINRHNHIVEYSSQQSDHKSKYNALLSLPSSTLGSMGNILNDLFFNCNCGTISKKTWQRSTLDFLHTICLKFRLSANCSDQMLYLHNHWMVNYPIYMYTL